MFALPREDELFPGDLVPVFGWRYQRRPVVYPGSSEPLQDLLKSKDWTRAGISALAQAVVGTG